MYTYIYTYTSPNVASSVYMYINRCCTYANIEMCMCTTYTCTSAGVAHIYIQKCVCVQRVYVHQQVLHICIYIERRICTTCICISAGVAHVYILKCVCVQRVYVNQQVLHIYIYRNVVVYISKCCTHVTHILHQSPGVGR